MNRDVYLYGPVTGRSYAAAEGWRDWMKNELAKFGIVARSPLRNMSYLEKLPQISGNERESAPLGVRSRPPGVVGQCHYDVHDVAMLVGNFLGADRVSIGSCCEHAWAYNAHKMIAVAMEPTGNPHDHMFFTHAINYRLETLEELRDTVIDVLSP